jgi:hypothetical protein
MSDPILQAITVLESDLKIAMERERVLRIRCEDPKQQYDWDDWMRAEGTVSGLGHALAVLQFLVKLSPRASKGPRSRAARTRRVSRSKKSR